MSAALFGLGLVLMSLGIVFLFVAALGLWRLPDLLSRLHVLTKADTAGLALVALGAACVSGSLAALLPLLLCVVLVAISGATIGHLVARSVTRRETAP
ncbi:Na(+)/H(+) antiporter subunit G [Roseivivax jejudonensis]|uniref:Na(+)/H(+) antiporter subunit G n=1 Tax=Roseivivax jejudonensis TaxID=1529041 RepID=A0A1X6Y6N0_9RHOB|nr:monovalent cation/H(+) antiporter subunit G [Roseivivax jejudonensis]SLN12186.1 Na(+)/H(+) antiporter subunit G [Roseivivax jejudonensis]